MVIILNNKSLWLKGIKDKAFPQLKQNIETDVLIIGGGITGITTAYLLKDSDLDVTLVEQNKIGTGQTSNSTGKLSYLQGTIYNKIENIYDKETAKKYLAAQKEAIDIVKDIIIENNIKCDFESNNSFIFTDKNMNISKLNQTAKILKYSKSNYKIVKNLPINYQSSFAIKVDDTAVFHPVKYLLELKRILKDYINIYENTKINCLEKKDNYYIAQTDKHEIKTKKVVLACHYPFFLKPYFFPFRTTLKKGYLCASLIDKSKRFNAISEDDNVHSIRYHSDSRNYIIYAGEEGTMGKCIDNETNFQNLFWQMKTTLSDKIKYYWFNYDIVTNDSLPIIGYLEKDNKNLLIGTGYNLWGMTNGTIAGKIISDLIQEKPNKYSELFNPNRLFNVNKLVNYFSFNLINGYNYVLSKVYKKPKFYKSVEIREENGKTYGVYTDDDGHEYIVSNLCPHMKCNLIFNEVDKTWDCPCHGSRFDINGKVIKGPSTYDIKIEKISK